jgi:hypothetical protein
MARPGVMVLLALSALVFFTPLVKMLRQGGLAMLRPSGRLVFKAEDLSHVAFIALGLAALASAQQWAFLARIGPTAVAGILVLAGATSLAYKMFFGAPTADTKRGVHMDSGSYDDPSLPARHMLLRAARFLGWLLAFLALTSLIGMVPTVPIVMLAFMRIEGGESWRLSLILAVCVTALLYGVFDRVLHVTWPASLLDAWLAARAA